MLIRYKEELEKYIIYFSENGYFETYNGATIIKSKNHKYLKIGNTKYNLLNVASMLILGEFNYKNVYFKNKYGDYTWDNLHIGKIEIRLTVDNIHKYLFYNPETGIFTWSIDMGFGRKKGDTAGTWSGYGYIKINFLNDTWQAHRLAVLFVEGYYPSKFMVVDHINGIKTDNRWCNLRIITQQENIQAAWDANFYKDNK